MARRNRERISSIVANELFLEGPNSNTTARITFQGNRLLFQDTRTGNNLLSVDSESNEVNFSNPIRLPDGSLLNTIGDVTVQDFELRASIPVVVYGADELPKNPDEPIIITAVLTNLDIEEATFTTNPEVELGGSGNTRTLYPASLLQIDKVDITATAGEFSETITISKVEEGDDGITVSISNPSDIIAADSSGEIVQGDLLNTRGQFVLYKGAQNLTALEKVSYRVDDVVNIDITIDNVTGEYEVTNFDQNAIKGSATLVAKYSGVDYTHSYRIIKAKSGKDGLNGTPGNDGESPYVGIVSDENIFIDTVNNDNVANINSQAVDQNNILIATIGNFELYKGTALQDNGVSYYVGAIGTNTNETKNNLTFSIDPSTGTYSASVNTTIVQEVGGWNTESETFIVRAVIDGVTVSTRKIKIQKTKIGKDGQSGPSLKLNISPSLFRFNGEGIPVEGQILTATVLSSNLPDAHTIEIISEPDTIEFGGDETSKTIAVEKFIDSGGEYLDSAVIKARVIVDNEIYLEDFVTIFRTQNGTDAKSIVLSSDSQVFSFKDSNSVSSTTDSVVINIKTQNLTQPISPSDVTITKNNGQSIDLLDNDLINEQDGSYSINLDYTSLEITDISSRDSTFPIKIRVDKQEVFDIMSIHKLIGGDGALSGFLTNETDQIPAFADGETLEEDYSTLNGNFKVFKGLEEVTAECSFAVTYDENMTTTVDSNGFYSVIASSLSASSNVGRAIVEASLNESTSIQKIFTVTKTKQGKNTLNVILSNETHTIRAESNGELVAVSDLNSAGGVASLYDGNEKQTSGVTYSVLQGDDTATTSASSYTTTSGLTLSISANGVYTLTTSNTTSWTGNTETFYIKAEYGNDLEILKSYTITKSKGGADAKLMRLNTNRMVFTFDSDNNPSPSSQEIILTANPTKGSVPIDTTVNWSVYPNTETNRALLKDLDPVNNKKKRILISDFKEANIQDLMITAESDNLEDSVTIVKAKDGASGEAARNIKVTATTMVVGYETEQDLVPDPESITVFINQQNLSNVLNASNVIITKKNSATLNPISIDSSGVNVNTKTGDSFFTISVGEDANDIIKKSDFPISIQVTSEEDNVGDIIRINKISGGKDGVDSITALLTNESHTAPAESNGFVSNDVLADAGGIFNVYEGLSEVINSIGTTDKIIYSVVGGTIEGEFSVLTIGNLELKINQSTGVYQLANEQNTSWDRNYQVFTLRAHYNEVDYDKKYTISKSKEGQKGIDGVNGINGLPGSDSKSVKLESDDYQIAYDEEGKNPQPETFTLSATQQNHDNNDAIFYFYEIEEDGSETIISQKQGDTESTRAILSPDERFTTKKYRVKTKETSNGNFISSDSISVVATKDGADSITIVIPNDNHTFPADSNGKITEEDNSLGSTEIEVYIGNDRLEAVPSETDGVATVLGKKQFYVTKTDSNIQTTLERIQDQEEPTKYYKYKIIPTHDTMNSDSSTVSLVIIARGNSDSSTSYEKLVSYSRSRKGVDGANGSPGSNGVSPVNGVLTNESHTVVADSDGVVSSLVGAEGIFRVYRGQTEITNTNNVAFSVIGTQPQNGLSVTIDKITDISSGESKGSYRAIQTDWKDSDSENFILQAIVDEGTSSQVILQKSFTITKSKAGANGEPAKYLILESNKQSFDKSYQGDESVFVPDGQTINFTASIYGEFDSTPDVTWYVDGEEVTNNKKLTVTTTTAVMDQDQFNSATFNLTNLSTTIKAEFSIDTVKYSDQITVILSQQAKNGSSGKDAKTVKLESDDYQIAYKQRGESDVWDIKPTSVTLKATPSETVNPDATKKYRFYINSNTAVVREDETANTFIIDDFENSYDEFQKRNIKVELIEEVGGIEEIVATDSIVVFATKDGSDAITIAMPNNNHSFPAFSTGVVDSSSYPEGVTEIEVYLGNRRLQPVASTTTDEQMSNYEFKISNVALENISLPNISTSTINGFVITTPTPYAMSVDSKTASITYEIKAKDSTGTIRTFLQKQSFTKSERGDDGLNAKALFLLSDSEGFYLNKDEVVVNDQIQFTTIKENISPNVSFSSVPAGVLSNIDVLNGTATLDYSDLDFGQYESVTVTVSVTDEKVYSDSIKIKKVESGIDGSSGTDAKVVKLESNDYQIAYDENGQNPDPNIIELIATEQNHKNVDYEFFLDDGSNETEIALQDGQDQNKRTVSVPENKFGSPLRIRVETREVADNGQLSEVIARDSISIVATKDGANSFTIVIPNDNHTFVADENGNVSDYSGAATDVQVYIGNTALKAVSQITDINQFKVSVAGTDNNISITNLSPSADDDTKYIVSGFNSMPNNIDSATLPLSVEIRGQTDSIETINKILTYTKARKGADGTDSFTGYLTNESHTVIADSDGLGYSLEGAGGNFEVFYGSQKLTQGVSYSIQGESTKDGLTATIHSSTGIYQFSGDLWSSNYETFTFRATYSIDGVPVSIDKQYSIIKSKAGRASTSGYLTNESHTVTTDSNGLNYELDESSYLKNAGGFFKILEGSQEATGFSFSVDSTTKDELTANIDSSTGEYTFSGTQWSADSTSFIFTATKGSGTNAVTIQKTYTITKSKAGVNGEPAKALFLYSDKQAFIKNGDGQFNPLVQKITFEASPQSVDSDTLVWKVDDDDDIGDTLTVYPNKLTASMDNEQFLAGVDLNINSRKVTVSSGDFSDSITVIATKDGAAAKALFLKSDKQSFKKDGNGNFYSGQEIIFTAEPKNITDNITWKLFKDEGTTDSSNLLDDVLDSNGTPEPYKKKLLVGNYSSVLGSDGVSAKIRIETAGGFFDEITIVTVEDGRSGDNAISGLLTNESHIVTTDSNGQNFDLTDAGGEFKVFYGNDDVTQEAILSIVDGTPPQNNNGIWTKADIADGTPTGLVLQLTESSGVYSLIVGEGEPWDGDSATFIMQAFYEAANITVQKTYTITKSKAGTDGTPAKSIRLSSTSQTFKKKKVNTGTTESPVYEENFDPSSQEITFTADTQNTTDENVTWAYQRFISGAWETVTEYPLTISGNDNEIAKMNTTQFENLLGSGTAVKITASSDGLSDSISIIEVVDGVDGLPGSTGFNARSVKLTSTSYIINYNSAGKSANPQTITLTASPSSTVTGEKKYSFTEETNTSPISGTSLKQNDTTATVSFSTTDHFTTPKLYKVTLYENDVEVANDSIVIAAVKEGSSARTAILSNESHTVPELTDDVIDYTGSGTKIQVFVGATPLKFVNSTILTDGQFKVTTTPTGITVGPVDNDSYSTETAIFKEHDNITADTSTIDYVITGKDSEGTEFTITKTQTITRSKKGKDGANAQGLTLEASFLGTYDGIPNFTKDRYGIPFPDEYQVLKIEAKTQDVPGSIVWSSDQIPSEAMIVDENSIFIYLWSFDNNINNFSITATSSQDATINQTLSFRNELLDFASIQIDYEDLSTGRILDYVEIPCWDDSSLNFGPKDGWIQRTPAPRMKLRVKKLYSLDAGGYSETLRPANYIFYKNELNSFRSTGYRWNLSSDQFHTINLPSSFNITNFGESFHEEIISSGKKTPQNYQSGQMEHGDYYNTFYVGTKITSATNGENLGWNTFGTTVQHDSMKQAYYGESNSSSQTVVGLWKPLYWDSFVTKIGFKVGPRIPGSKCSFFVGSQGGPYRVYSYNESTGGTIVQEGQIEITEEKYYWFEPTDIISDQRSAWSVSINFTIGSNNQYSFELKSVVEEHNHWEYANITDHVTEQAKLRLITRHKAASLCTNVITTETQQSLIFEILEIDTQDLEFTSILPLEVKYGDLITVQIDHPIRFVRKTTDFITNENIQKVLTSTEVPLPNYVEDYQNNTIGYDYGDAVVVYGSVQYNHYAIGWVKEEGDSLFLDSDVRNLKMYYGGSSKYILDTIPYSVMQDYNPSETNPLVYRYRTKLLNMFNNENPALVKYNFSIGRGTEEKRIPVNVEVRINFYESSMNNEGQITYQNRGSYFRKIPINNLGETIIDHHYGEFVISGNPVYFTNDKDLDSESILNPPSSATDFYTMTLRVEILDFNDLGHNVTVYLYDLGVEEDYKGSPAFGRDPNLMGFGTNFSTVPKSQMHLKQVDDNPSSGLTFEKYDKNDKWNMTINKHSVLRFAYGTTDSADSDDVATKGYIDIGTSVGKIDFTGQHRNIFNKQDDKQDIDLTGMIVVSDGVYKNIDGFNNPMINESLPIVSLSSKRNQKNVWGIVSDSEDANSDFRDYSNGNFVSVYSKQQDDNRLIINSLGEGGIWVSNINGNLENGDYITTCEIPGYGMKQDDDLLHNYTVAKITCDCDFNLQSSVYICEEFQWQGQTYRKAFVGCTYHCG